MPAESTPRIKTSAPLPSFQNQDQIFRAAFSILQDAVAQQAFPCASLAVTQNGKLVALKSLGTFIYPKDIGTQIEPADGNVDSPTPSTLFDVASLTKVLATATMAAILHERGHLELDAPITGTLPQFRSPSDPRRDEVTFRMLLAHSSGLPAYVKLFFNANSREELLQAALATPLTAAAGTRAEYSDIGFIVLGTALERIAEESLEAFCRREIFGPLAMGNTTFNPPQAARPNIPPTADEREDQKHRAGASARQMPSAQTLPSAGSNPRSTFRNRIIQGEVQDENAFVLGGIAGHAGLFSNAEDLARFAHTMLQGGGPLLRPETIALFTHPESHPPGTSRALGWDTPSNPSQSGKYFGPNSYGHLGYTGTSLWIDPDRKLSITLLTNRTWPDCSNQAIKEVRPKFHNAIVEALDR